MKSCVSWLTLLLAIPILATPVSGQSVRGRVVLADSVTPVVSATIVALDASGEAVGRALSGQDGRFFIRLLRAGNYELRAIRIGYRPARVPIQSVAADETRSADIVMIELPLELASIHVLADDQCGMSRGESDRFIQLWQQARRALGSHVSSLGGAMDVRVLQVEGTEDGPLTLPGGHRVWNPNNRSLEVDSAQARVVYTDTLLATTPAETLTVHGYARRRADGSVVFDVPNPDALLSDAFLARHCFDVENGPSGHPDWVGISFRPISDLDSLADVAGTLWLDKATSEVRRLDFGYRNLPRIPVKTCVSKNRPKGQRSGEARYGPYCLVPSGGGWIPSVPEGTGGTLDFAYVERGAWFVSQWTIRTPGKEFMDRYAGYNMRPEQGTIVKCNDRPSACTRVIVAVPRLVVSSGAIANLLNDGVELYRSPSTLAALSRIAAMQAKGAFAHITGIVADADGRPVPRAVISTANPVRSVMTDESGRFELRMLPAGELTMQVRRAGYQTLQRQVELAAKATLALELRLTEPPPGRQPDRTPRGIPFTTDK